MGTKFTDQLANGETVLYENKRCNANIPKGKGHKSVPGTLYVTDRRIVHDYKGLFGMGASRHQIPIRLVTTVSTGAAGLGGYVEVATLDGKTTRFMLRSSDATQVMEHVQTRQADQQFGGA